MGLLDDAIREHLELKRRSGADPGEIARQERVVLESASGAQDGGAEAVGAEEEYDDAVALEHDAEAEFPAAAAHDADEIFAEEPAPRISPGDAISHAGQETAELDMEAVLGGEDTESAAPAGTEEPDYEPAASNRPFAARPPESRPGDVGAVDWDEPGDAEYRGGDEQIPGQERFTLE